jgi:hypothetical protein
MEQEVFLATVLPLAFFALVFGIVYIRNRENMALIEKGINPRQAKSATPSPLLSLKYGMLLCGSGVGWTIAYFIDMNMNHRAITRAGTVYYEDNAAIYFALIAIGGGLGLVTSYLIEKKHWRDNKRED